LPALEGLAAKEWLRWKLGLMILVLVGTRLILTLYRGAIRGKVLLLGSVGSTMVVELSLSYTGSLGALIALLFGY
jgi:hypothetical protein